MVPERVAQLVRQARRKLAQGRQTLRPVRRCLRLLQIFVGLRQLLGGDLIAPRFRPLRLRELMRQIADHQQTDNANRQHSQLIRRE